MVRTNWLSCCKNLRAKLRRERIQGGGEMIRFAKTLEMLVDISGEDLEIEVVTHEATHQLAANSGLLDREKFMVRWAHEGLASYFESPKEATWAGLTAVNEQRLGYYRILERDPEHSSIEFVVTDRIFDYAGTQLFYSGSIRTSLGVDTFPDGKTPARVAKVLQADGGRRSGNRARRRLARKNAQYIQGLLRRPEAPWNPNGVDT